MHLYVAWYQGDPVYPAFDPDCSLLVSPTSVANRWRVRDLLHMPARLIIDSGGFRYAFVDEPPNQQVLFERQLRMIEGVTCQTTLCALDYPLLPRDISSGERDRAIYHTLANASEFLTLASRYAVPAQVQLMGVVQGYDVHSLVFCARELQRMGYRQFGIGSLARLYNNEEITRRVSAVREAVGHGLHVFGVSSVQLATHLRSHGVVSVDSSRPAKAAMYNVLFSSHPFRRHRIRPTRGRYQQATYIDEPFPCSCPACGGKANADLLKLGKREYVYLRTLHNYFHLKRSIEGSIQIRS